MSESTSKRKIRDSVFTSLFQEKKYLLQLYKALHPEDREVMTLFDDEQIYKAFEDDIKQETAKEVVRNKAIFMIQKGKLP